MNRTGFDSSVGFLILTCVLLPCAAQANPVMLNPSSLMAFGIVALWAFVVEAGVVALLLVFRALPAFLDFLAAVAQI